eukprot:scaffold67258_cov75-Phaeocystis_antarctica.AAC.4
MPAPAMPAVPPPLMPPPVMPAPAKPPPLMPAPAMPAPAIPPAAAPPAMPPPVSPVASPTAPGLGSIFDSLAYEDLEVIGDEFAMALTEDTGVLDAELEMCNKRQKTSLSA